MKKITSDQLFLALKNDPDWAVNLSEKIVVSDFCHFDAGVPVTHLGPNLHFGGSDGQRNCASFLGGKVKRIECTFHGGVDLTKSLVCDTKGMVVTKPNISGVAANFYECRNLTVASGKFCGYVNFQECPITKIEDLKVKRENVPLLCNLAATPVSKENPMAAAEAMTGSSDPKEWEKILPDLHGWGHILSLIEQACCEARRKKLKATLRPRPKKKSVCPLEI
jgi:hypothetical protein